MKTGPHIETASGRVFYLNDPEFYPPDIAHALARINRWNGTSTMPISVAEHSVHVSYLIQEEGGHPLEGLLHDFAEAYLGDIPAPFKRVLPDFKKMEQRLWEALIRRGWEDFQLPLDTILLKEGLSEECRRADTRSMFIEAREVIRSQGRNWTGYLSHGPTEYDMPCHFWTPEVAEERWLLRLEEIDHTL